MNFFVLAYSHWEDYVPHFFTGPDNVSEEEFKNICQNLLPQAGLALVALDTSDEFRDFIGWNEIVEAVIPFLEAKGFTHIQPKRAVFSGSGIISKDEAGLLGQAAEAVVRHNTEIYRQMDEEMKANKENQ